MNCADCIFREKSKCVWLDWPVAQNRPQPCGGVHYHQRVEPDEPPKTYSQEWYDRFYDPRFLEGIK